MPPSIHNAVAEGNLAAVERILKKAIIAQNAGRVSVSGGEFGSSVLPPSSVLTSPICACGGRRRGDDQDAAEEEEEEEESLFSPLSPSDVSLSSVHSVVGPLGSFDDAHLSQQTVAAAVPPSSDFRRPTGVPLTPTPTATAPHPMVNAKDATDRTPLLIAIQRGHTEIAHALIDRYHCDVNIGSGSWTPLQLAAREGAASVVGRLVAAGACLERVVCGWTALHLAARNGHSAVVEILVANRCRPLPSDPSAPSLLEFAALCGSADTVAVLLREGYDPCRPSPHGFNTLFYGIRSGSLPVVRLLLSNGADPNALLPCGSTSLHMAVRYNHADIVDLLVTGRNGGDEDGDDDDEDSAPSATADTGALLLPTPNPSPSSSFPSLPPSTASAAAATAAATNTIRGPCAPNIPIPIPIPNSRSTRCDLDAPNYAGDTPLHIAVEEGNLAMCAHLLAMGASTEGRTIAPLWRTPLHAAAARGDALMMGMLLASGCEPDTVDGEGNSSVAIAELRDSGGVGNGLAVMALLEGGCHSSQSPFAAGAAAFDDGGASNNNALSVFATSLVKMHRCSNAAAVHVVVASAAISQPNTTNAPAISTNPPLHVRRGGGGCWSLDSSRDVASSVARTHSGNNNSFTSGSVGGETSNAYSAATATATATATAPTSSAASSASGAATPTPASSAIIIRHRSLRSPSPAR